MRRASHALLFTTLMAVADTSAGVSLQVRGFLQGAYNTDDGLMRNDLAAADMLPLTHPYSRLEHKCAQTTTAAMLATTGTDAPVDWILVEIRDADNPAIRWATTAALLQRDGDIVDPQTGSTTLHIEGLEADNYHVGLRHRNHLGVMTRDAIPLSDTTASIDFSSPLLAVAGEHARQQVGGKALLWSGDVNHNNNLIVSGPNNDSNTLLGSVLHAADNVSGSSNFLLRGYADTDLNMDGVTLYVGPGNDSNLLRRNVLQHPANTSMATNYIIHDALPK